MNPLPDSHAGDDRNAGLKSAIDIIVAPGDAFARLRERPTWVSAYLIAALWQAALLALGVFAAVGAAFQPHSA